MAVCAGAILPPKGIPPALGAGERGVGGAGIAGVACGAGAGALKTSSSKGSSTGERAAPEGGAEGVVNEFPVVGVERGVTAGVEGAMLGAVGVTGVLEAVLSSSKSKGLKMLSMLDESNPVPVCGGVAVA